MPFLLVGLGSAVGGVTRYWLGSVMAERLGYVFPFGTIAINTLGSFLIVVIMKVSVVAPGSISPEARLFLTTGILGGFTTYSSFNYESIKLFQDGEYLLGAANLLGTLVLGLLAGGLGLMVARWIAPS